ncbi:MAG: HU family DNA-binding protein [Pseudomonadota bacterium]
MNKTELVSAMAESADMSKADAGKALDAITASITDALKGGDSVSLVGFATIKTSERSARSGRNPQTGEAIQIPASTSVGMTFGKAVKDTVNS